MMDDTVTGMSCFERHLKVALFVQIKGNAHFFQPHDILRTLGNKYLDCFEIVFVFACDKCIGDMQLKVIVVFVKHRCHTALCQRRIGERQLAFGDQQHADILGKLQRSIQTRSTAANDQNVIFFFHKASILFFVLSVYISNIIYPIYYSIVCRKVEVLNCDFLFYRQIFL